MSQLSKIKNLCLKCGQEPERPTYKYCSNLCQREFEYDQYIKDWKEGRVSGLQGLGIVSRYVKKFLRRKYGNKCCLCGWSQVNMSLGEVPLVADHIDGDWRNNKEENLRLICPNCDSLTPTYAGLNRGKGRGNRERSKRAVEGKFFISQVPK